MVARYGWRGGALREMRTDPFQSEARYLSGGGGLLTTVDDYARFAQALLDGGAPIRHARACAR